MGRSGLQISVAAMLGLIACVAVNLWLFRVGFVYGLVGLNLTKHVAVAVFCQMIGVNRRATGPLDPSDQPDPRVTTQGVPGS